MSTLIGNLLALTVLAVSASTGAFTSMPGALVYGAISYISWGLLWAGDRLSQPSQSSAVCRRLDRDELRVYRAYHSWLRAPAGADVFSNFLNSLRLLGFVWAATAFWQGSAWLGVALLAYFFLSGGIILRFAPITYLGRPAARGHLAATEHLRVLQTIQSMEERIARSTPAGPPSPKLASTFPSLEAVPPGRTLPRLADGDSYDVVIRNVSKLLSAGYSLQEARPLVLKHSGLKDIPRRPDGYRAGDRAAVVKAGAGV